MICILVGESEVYLCAMDYLGGWIAAGYRLFGVADTVGDVWKVYTMAVRECGVTEE
ncbi:hypothetical protein AAC03nite_34380 [Alicyclobacillus acidoterrestris]|nr:hypothetical protein AAC03nite_34380 [Alicyclobacillus acidoterrestris]